MSLKENTIATNLSEIINQTNREEIAKGLSEFLADSYMLYLKAQNYHWNVTGIHFLELHEMFEKQYRDLAEAIDEIAERIRALGFVCPGSFSEFQSLTCIPEDIDFIDHKKMVANLLNAHEAVAKTANTVLKVADSAGDEVTVDLLISRINIHQKTAWMLRSMLVE